MLINQRLGPDARPVTLNNIFARFLTNPNDSNNNRELRNIERRFNENSDLNESQVLTNLVLSQNENLAGIVPEVRSSYASKGDLESHSGVQLLN